MPKTRRQGFLAGIIKLVILGLAIVYGLAAVTSPWAFHIGGRWTPLSFVLVGQGSIGNQHRNAYSFSVVGFVPD